MEFHIFSFDFGERATVKGVGEALDREFPSLFAAALYARTQLKNDAGLVVIHDGPLINRIPVNAGLAPVPPTDLCPV